MLLARDKASVLEQVHRTILDLRAFSDATHATLRAHPHILERVICLAGEMSAAREAEEEEKVEEEEEEGSDHGDKEQGK